MNTDTEYMENMARAYSEKLTNSSLVPTVSTTSAEDPLFEQFEILLENQLDVIGNMLNYPLNRYLTKLLNYLKTLKYNSLRELSKLQSSEYIPSFRTPTRMCNYNAAKMRLADLQIDIFVILDKLSREGIDLTNLIFSENRAMAIISALN